jgi:hypothetical protein
LLILIDPSIQRKTLLFDGSAERDIHLSGRFVLHAGAKDRHMHQA